MPIGRVVSKRLVITLAGLFCLLAIFYLSSPWIIAAFVKSKMHTYGFTDIELQVSYPGWRQTAVRAVTFTHGSTSQLVMVQLPTVQIEYRLFDLLQGTISRIVVPNVKLEARPSDQQINSIDKDTAAPILPLVSGRWLTELPVKEFRVEQLNADAQFQDNQTYKISMQAHLHDAQLILDGRILIDSAKQSMRISSVAKHTGETILSLYRENDDSSPILEWKVESVEYANAQIGLKGTGYAKLNDLVPIVAPWITRAEWITTLQGELRTQWQADMPDALADATNHWHVVGTMSIDNLSMQWQGKNLPSSRLKTKYIANAQSIKFDASLHTAQDAIKMTVDGRYEYASGLANAEYMLLPVTFSPTGLTLSKLLPDWSFPFEVDGGQISAQGKIVLRNSMQLQADLRLDKLAGHYRQVLFEGVDGNIPLKFTNTLQTSEVAHVTIHNIDVGFPLKNTELRFALVSSADKQIPVVQIKNFNTYLLGGRARTDPFEYSYDKDRNDLLLHLSDLRLAEIIALEQQEGLSGTGVLDGQIPIEIHGTELLVTEGRLSAREPGGVIQYVPTAKIAALAESNASVGMMVKALSNFQYQVLDVKSDYKAGGDLLLQVRLEGKNPDWQRGRPVNLNLNLQENIPALLRSLQLSDEISEEVRKRYQKTP